MLQPQGHRRFEKAELVAAIKALAGKAQSVEGLAVLDQSLERVGQLDLPTAAGLTAAEMAKDLRLDDVAADDRQGRRRLRRVRLFDDSPCAHQPAVVGN